MQLALKTILAVWFVCFAAVQTTVTPNNRSADNDAATNPHPEVLNDPQDVLLSEKNFSFPLLTANFSKSDSAPVVSTLLNETFPKINKTYKEPVEVLSSENKVSMVTDHQKNETEFSTILPMVDKTFDAPPSLFNKSTPLLEIFNVTVGEINQEKGSDAMGKSEIASGTPITPISENVNSTFESSHKVQTEEPIESTKVTHMPFKKIEGGPQFKSADDVVKEYVNKTKETIKKIESNVEKNSSQINGVNCALFTTMMTALYAFYN